MASGNRIAKINDEMKRELGALLPRLKDPRIHGLVSITRVDVTRDMRYAKVYISVLPVNPGAGGEDISPADEVVKGLSSAAGFLRHEMGQRLALRMAPELKFIADDSIERGSRIIGVLNEIRKNG